jgi:phosphoribosylamine--glycine ligase
MRRKMLTYLFISEDGSGIEIAIRCAQEGIHSLFHITDKHPVYHNPLVNYKNPTLVPKLTTDIIDKADVIVFTTVHNGNLAEALKENHIVFGGGDFNDKLELDRAYGNKVAKLTKADIPGTVKFKNIEKGLAYIKEKGSVAVKANGNISTTLSLVSNNYDYIESVMEANKKDFEGDGFIVQDKIAGIEISTEGWFNGKRFIPELFNHTIEKKRIGEGNIGVPSGCMGNVVWSASDNDKIVQGVLMPLEPLLQEANYCGVIDVNCMVNKDKAYFLEFSARFGFDAIQAFTGMLSRGIAGTIWDCCLGDENIKPVVKKGYNMAVRLTLPPYPMWSPEAARKLNGLQVLDINKGARKHVWLSDIAKNKKGKEVLAGIDGNIGCVTAGGNTVDMCRERVYNTISNVVITPDVYYRVDIADGIEDNIKQLKDWGWL